MAEMDDDDLLEALGVETAPIKGSGHTALQERLMAGFEDILRFVDANGRVPQHGEERDIFERLYAVRLDRLRGMPDARELLASLDTAGLLNGPVPAAVGNVDDLDDEALLAELGADSSPDEDDITRLRHVSSYADRKAAEEIANRTKCEDFEKFQPLFEKVRRELESGDRRTKVLETRSLDEIQKGTYFIVSGQIAYVAEETEAFTTSYERRGQSGARDLRQRNGKASYFSDLSSEHYTATRWPGSFQSLKPARYLATRWNLMTSQAEPSMSCKASRTTPTWPSTAS